MQYGPRMAAAKFPCAHPVGNASRSAHAPASPQAQRRPPKPPIILLYLVGALDSGGAAWGGRLGRFHVFSLCQDCVVDLGGGGHIYAYMAPPTQVSHASAH
jgi:hypothetical protein